MTFGERVIWLVCQIPEGRVATYGQVATLAGQARAARAVGTILRHSPVFGHDVPWHRVINAQGRISWGGDLERAELQRRLLEAEGVAFDAAGTCALAQHQWRPTELFWDA